VNKSIHKLVTNDKKPVSSNSKYIQSPVIDSQIDLHEQSFNDSSQQPTQAPLSGPGLRRPNTTPSKKSTKEPNNSGNKLKENDKDKDKDKDKNSDIIQIIEKKKEKDNEVKEKDNEKERRKEKNKESEYNIKGQEKENIDTKELSVQNNIAVNKSNIDDSSISIEMIEDRYSKRLQSELAFQPLYKKRSLLSSSDTFSKPPLTFLSERPSEQFFFSSNNLPDSIPMVSFSSTNEYSPSSMLFKPLTSLFSPSSSPSPTTTCEPAKLTDAIEKTSSTLTQVIESVFLFFFF